MIGGRLRNGSVRQSHDRKKVDGMNYLIWSESDRQRADRRYRRQWSISDSTTPPSKRPRGSREKIELDRRKSALDSSNEQYHDRSWLSRVSGEMPPEVSKIDSHLLLNIGGNHFRVRCSTIEYRCPTSFLATFARLPHEERLLRCDGYIESSEEYFFERSAKVFEPIYDFLATGHFHRHGDICAERLYQELDYWKINGNMFAPCCMPNVDGSGDEDGEATGSLPSGECDDHYDEIRCSNLRRQLWLLMEDPSSSTSAKGFALVSISMVIVSVTGMILASLPDIQADSVNNSSAIDEENLSLKPHLLLDYIELVCLIWFTIEYLVRFAVCTKKCEFACKPLNIIDSLTIIPFYLEMILHVAGLSGLGAHTIGEFRGLAMVMRGVRVMRVARIFKLARYSSGLKSFGMTVKTSLAELSMLTLFLLTAIIFFSTLMYFAERDEPGTKFKSIPHAGWWCIVTMTTVGYGDFCPQTVFGKLIASCASISGVLVLAFPITMIVENFSKNYDTEKNDFKITQRRRRMAKAFV